MVYRDPPWVFKGRAWYQLQLVKSSDARKYIPSEFKLVEFFGYTLGGFYLARYSDSPAGDFDELVALAGLVWNPPTSCAWAARVYVSSKEARDHGLHHVGLPSRLAAFKEEGLRLAACSSEGGTPCRSEPGSPWASFWHCSTDCPSNPFAQQQCSVEVQNTERRGWFSQGRGLATPVCCFQFPCTADSTPGAGWGPRLNLQLPSFSGGTREFPQLVQYTCQLAANVKVKRPVRVEVDEAALSRHADSSEMIACVLQGAPVVALVFDDMVMDVDAPQEWKGY